MEPKTLKHHRKTDNMYQFGFGRQTITVARRFLPSGALRVRVTSTTSSGQGQGNWTDYRDYTDTHDGDVAYTKQANDLCSKWEERYINTSKKETTVNQPTHEQLTSTTAVRHLVGEDGHTACGRPATPPAKGHEPGRVVGEHTFKVRGGRMGRTDAMLALLKAMNAHIKAAEAVTEARRVVITENRPTAERVNTLQVHATYFRALREAGYAPHTTWDGLVNMLRPIVSTALHGLDDQRAALSRVNSTGQASIQRSLHAAELFLKACEPVLSFFQPDDEGDEDCPDCGATRDEDEGTGEVRCPSGCDNL